MFRPAAKTIARLSFRRGFRALLTKFAGLPHRFRGFRASPTIARQVAARPRFDADVTADADDLGSALAVLRTREPLLVVTAASHHLHTPRLVSNRSWFLAVASVALRCLVAIGCVGCPPLLRFPIALPVFLQSADVRPKSMFSEPGDGLPRCALPHFMSPRRQTSMSSLACWNSRVSAQNGRALRDGFHTACRATHLSWVFPPSRD